MHMFACRSQMLVPDVVPQDSYPFFFFKDSFLLYSFMCNCTCVSLQAVLLEARRSHQMDSLELKLKAVVTQPM